MTRRASANRAADRITRVVLGGGTHVPLRVERGEPDTVGGLEKLGVDLLPAQPGLFIQADDLGEERARQVGLVGIEGVGGHDRAGRGQFVRDALKPGSTFRQNDFRLGLGR
jgi:hypothetical protein